MQNLYRSRFTILVFLIFLYLIPVLLLSSYGQLHMPPQKAWNFLAFGLFFSSMGTLGLFWVMCRMGGKKATVPSIEKQALPQEEALVKGLKTDLSKKQEELQEYSLASQEQIKQLQGELELKNEEFNRLQHEYQVLQEQSERIQRDHDRYRDASTNELEEQKRLLLESQKTIADQREAMDKKLQQIAQLESKVSDLTYEIKTLIQLAEIENQTMPMYPNLPLDTSQSHFSSTEATEDEISCSPEKQVTNEAQAAVQLKRCIDIAQKITGANHYNNSNSRFRDLAIDNYTLDLRRLFDSLRMENSSAIIFYSQKENKILFVNNQSKNLLGWSPDKFMLSFNDIVEPDADAWKQGIASLAIKNTAQIGLKMKSKQGPVIDIRASLGIIPTGIFRQHILGVLYKA